MNRQQKTESPNSICPITQDPEKRIAANKVTATFKDRLPKGIGEPALRAFAAAGYTDLEQFTRITEKELGALHGVGPKSIRLLREELQKQGKSFLPPKK